MVKIRKIIFPLNVNGNFQLAITALYLLTGVTAEEPARLKKGYVK
jgi:hypothetical protein